MGACVKSTERNCSSSVKLTGSSCVWCRESCGHKTHRVTVIQEAAPEYKAHSGFCERLQPSPLLEKMAGHPGVIPHRTLHALCIITFIILNICSLSASVRFSVIGPDQPVVVLPGEDAELPCHLSPQASAENMTVRWFKDNYISIVHLYHNGRDRNEDQLAKYKRRTELIKDDIRFGIVPLLIYNVRSDDSGQYSCFIDTGSFYEEAVVELKVAAVGSHPHIYLEESQNGGIQIVCMSSGWYPEPEVLWKDGNGENISSSLEVNTPEGSLRFHIKATYIIPGGANTFSCCINNSALSQWKESTIHISESYLQRVSTCSITRILICASFTFLEIAFLSLAAYCYKRRKKIIGILYARLESLTEELENLPQEIEWRRARRFAGAVTLDPDTANPWLLLSEAGRSVRDTDTEQDLPDTPERFNPVVSVLGRERLTSGRHYWEVEVGDKTDWALGVCDESVSRKGEISLAPGKGYWAVYLEDGDQYWACTSPYDTRLTPRARPRAVGFFLDYEAGRLSVYSVEGRSLLFTFPRASFPRTLRPYFSPYLNAGGKNAGALRILPVTED